MPSALLTPAAFLLLTDTPALLAALLLACGMHARLTLYTITRRPDAQSQQRQADLER